MRREVGQVWFVIPIVIVGVVIVLAAAAWLLMAILSEAGDQFADEDQQRAAPRRSPALRARAGAHHHR